MTEESTFWGGTAIGDHGTYTDDQFSDFMRILFQRDRTSEGVVPAQLSELAVTNPSGVTIRTSSGYALVDGKLYHNSANIDNDISAPVSGSYYYRIVLRKDFAAQTVRLTVLGPDISAYPALTQNDGSVWEIPLAKIQITSASVITVTNERVYVHPSIEITSAMLLSLKAAYAEVSIGSDNNKYVTPYSLGKSIFGTKPVEVRILAKESEVDSTYGIIEILVPSTINGMHLVRAQAMVDVAGTTNPTTVQVRNMTKYPSNDALSTPISIASGDRLGTIGVVDSAYDDVSTDDILRFYVVSFSSTKAKGLTVLCEYTL